MKKVTIYGASDDLIEVEGSIREEFNPSCDEPSYLGFSDGTVLEVQYGASGFWRINRLFKGSADCQKEDATDEDTDYSDKVTLTGDVDWVVFGSTWAKGKKVKAS
jgi:hypothetical protein